MVRTPAPGFSDTRSGSAQQEAGAFIRREVGSRLEENLVARVEEAADKLRNAAFPPGSFPPHLPFVPA